jgi:hypothetical protein
VKLRYLVVFGFIGCAVAISIAAIVLVDGSSGGPSIRARLRDELEPVQAQVDFSIILPSYLPSGTNPAPQGVVEDEEVIVYLWRKDADDYEPHERADIDIYETNRADADWRYPPIPGQPGAHSGIEYFEIAGEEVATYRVEKSDSAVAVVFSADLEGIRVAVIMSWRADSGNTLELSQEMQNEAIKVFESMIESDNG